MAEKEEKTQLVQMRFKQNTLERINKISRNSGIDNRTQVLSNAIQLTEVLSDYLHSGAKIYIEKDGKKELLTIVGI